MAERDVRDLARIGALDAMPRLLSLAAAQTARLLNVSEFAAPFVLTAASLAIATAAGRSVNGLALAAIAGSANAWDGFTRWMHCLTG